MKENVIGVIAVVLAFAVIIVAALAYLYYMWIYPITYMWSHFTWISVALTIGGNAVLLFTIILSISVSNTRVENIKSAFKKQK